jgi:WhiB family redox-sensing transcriptional regulator
VRCVANAAFLGGGWGSEHTAGEELLDLLSQRPASMADALCREFPELSWFPSVGETATACKAVCARCAVVAECRTWSLAQGPHLHGVWAGLSERERSRLRAAG